MKLYVWNNPRQLPYGGSCLYVMAESEDDASEQARKALDARFGSLSDHRKIAVLENLGAPDRIHEGPVAELYWWEE